MVGIATCIRRFVGGNAKQQEKWVAPAAVLGVHCTLRYKKGSRATGVQVQVTSVGVPSTVSIASRSPKPSNWFAFKEKIYVCEP